MCLSTRTREERRHGHHDDAPHLRGEGETDTEGGADDGGGDEGGAWRELQLVDEQEEHEDGDGETAHETCQRSKLLLLHVQVSLCY